jgi:hypothetical protein
MYRGVYRKKKQMSKEQTPVTSGELGHVQDTTPFIFDPKDYLIREMLGALQNSLYFIEALEDNNIVNGYHGKESMQEVIGKANKMLSK